METGLALTLTPLAQADAAGVEALLDAAFGADRHARTAYKLRNGVAWLPVLSFAAWNEMRLVGTLQSWPVALRAECGDERLVMVGPVAVLPEVQGQGVGKALMDRLIAVAPEDSALMMIGDPEYYGRWGFTAEHTGGWRIDGAYEQRRLLARLGRAVALDGQLVSTPHSGEGENRAGTRFAA